VLIYPRNNILHSGEQFLDDNAGQATINSVRRPIPNYSAEP